MTLQVIFCPRCQRGMQLKEDGSYSEPQHLPTDPPSRLVFGHCIQCDQPGIVRVTEDGFDEYSQQLFPRQMKHAEFPLPPKVKESYEEAVLCHEAGAWLATSVMVRRTLEAVGRQFDPTAKRPVEGMKAMKDQGVISEELYQWGEELRFLGNIGAHPTDDVITSQDAQEAIDLARAIIETIYDLRPKFQAMRARRLAAKTKVPRGDVESD